jgi:transcriptional regulator with XRE-family HTH domain
MVSNWRQSKVSSGPDWRNIMPVSFARRLRELREAAGLSQYELAKQSGVSKQALSKLERGERQPSWETVRKLARALNVSVAAFDEDDEDARRTRKG